MIPKDKLCIFLVRHCETDWNVKGRIQGSSDIPLNRKGLWQARALAKKFRQISLTHIYSSHMKRARQTAMFIAKTHKLKVKLDPVFRERSMGLLEGLTKTGLLKKYPHFSDEWKRDKIDWSCKGSETIRHMLKRAMAAFKKIIRKHKPGDRVLIVSHGGPLKGLIHLLHGGKPLDYWHGKNLDNAQIVELHVDGKKAKVVSSYFPFKQYARIKD